MGPWRPPAEGCKQAQWRPSCGPAASWCPACFGRARTAQPRAQRPPEVTPAASERAYLTPLAGVAARRRPGRESPRPRQGVWLPAVRSATGGVGGGGRRGQGSAAPWVAALAWSRRKGGIDPGLWALLFRLLEAAPGNGPSPGLQDPSGA